MDGIERKGEHTPSSGSIWCLFLRRQREASRLLEGNDDERSITLKRCSAPVAYLIPSWLSNWTRELAYMLFSLSCMVAIIVLAIYVNRRPLQDWRLPISPNAATSVLSISSKAAMLLVIARCISQLTWIHFHQKARSVAQIELFDEASRGPLGSCILLWCLRWRAPVTSGCALVTVLALAMDPFVQQILSYSTEQTVSDHGHAFLPVARSWANAANLRDHELDWGSLYRSFVSLDTKVDFTCSTGNCTWPLYTSLSLCCDCDVVTAASRTRRNITVLQKGAHYILDLQYTTPRGLELHTPVELYYNATYGYVNPKFIVSTAKMSNRTDQWHAGSSSFLLPEIAIASFPAHFWYELPGDWRQLTTVNLTRPEIYDCRFHYCETLRATEVRSGRLYESIQSSRTLDTTTIADCPGDKRFPCGYAASKFNGSESYVIGEQQAGTLGPFLFAAFHPDRHSFNANISALTPLTALWSPNHGNVSRTVHDVSEAITKYMRQGSSSTPLPGKVDEPTTVINVRWPWLSLPVANVFLATALLRMTIVLSKAEPRVVWKSSTLPLLFHGLNGWKYDRIDPKSMAEMRNEARAILAQLSEDNDGALKLVRTDE